MRLNLGLALTAVALFGSSLGGAARAADESWIEKFEATHERYSTIPDEPWRQIPWGSELLTAQREAAQRELPLFIWAMDGNPLGCT